MKTENQIRSWLKKKLENYLWKIQGTNAYGSKKKLETIGKEIKKILDQYWELVGKLKL